MSRINRRRFLQQTAAVAAPMIIPASALGTQEKPPPSNRLTIGMIGVGKMGMYHLDRFTTNFKQTQVVAISDVDTTRREFARKTAEERGHKGCTGHNDYREILGRKDVDAVCIATPDHWHAAAALDAIAAGKDVYCEKPLTLTIREAQLLVEAVRKHGRVFQTGSQQRSDWEFQVAVDLVRKGAIGKITKVLVDVGGPSKPCDLPAEDPEPGLDWERWLGPAPMRSYNSILSPRGICKNFPAWRNYREYSGGSMTDWGAHHFDIAQWGLGMDESGPVEIIPPEDPKATKGVRFVYANGVEVIHGGGGGVTFIGEGGEIFVNRGKLSSKPEDLTKPYFDDKKKRPKTVSHHQNWLDCIKSRQKPIADVEIGARTIAVCHLGNHAYWNGRKLKWDPKDWRFVGDEAANAWLDRERRAPYALPKV